MIVIFGIYVLCERKLVWFKVCFFVGECFEMVCDFVMMNQLHIVCQEVWCFNIGEFNVVFVCFYVDFYVVVDNVFYSNESFYWGFYVCVFVLVFNVLV